MGSSTRLTLTVVATSVLAALATASPANAGPGECCIDLDCQVQYPEPVCRVVTSSATETPQAAYQSPTPDPIGSPSATPALP